LPARSRVHLRQASCGRQEFYLLIRTIPDASRNRQNRTGSVNENEMKVDRQAYAVIVTLPSSSESNALLRTLPVLLRQRPVGDSLFEILFCRPRRSRLCAIE
jgi:hypothetical protein